VEVKKQAFVPCFTEAREPGLSPAGVTEDFSTAPPLSHYGSAKLAWELLILENGLALNFPVFIDRCGVLAGAGQFGKPDQGDPTPRRFDVPWLVLDPALAAAEWNWRPATKLEGIFDEIATHAEQHPEWLDLSEGA